MTEIIGNIYFYETKGGTIKQSKLIGKSKAWLMFENGDWIESYSQIYETKEELLNINEIVNAIYKNTYVPDVVHIPNRFTR